MIFDYCVPRYKCAHMFKALCKFGPCLWDPCVACFNFGPHNIFSLYLYSPLGGWPFGDPKPISFFIFFPLISLSLHLPPPPFSPSIILHWRIKTNKDSKAPNFSKNQGTRAKELNLGRIWKHKLKISRVLISPSFKP